jgi:hypothetical protein
MQKKRLIVEKSSPAKHCGATQNIPERNIPGRNIPGQNIPGRNIPERNIPRINIPGRIQMQKKISPMREKIKISKNEMIPTR